jgi:hypothetical protein
MSCKKQSETYCDSGTLCDESDEVKAELPVRREGNAYGYHEYDHAERAIRLCDTETP